jgi:hypothetical protein
MPKGIGEAMTIALSLKVHEGIVLASDSASTVVGQGPGNMPVAIKVYNNANKIFNLLKGAPIGASTWGAGAIGQASIAMLVKDLRRRFSGLDSSRGKKWQINPAKYEMLWVAERVREFIFEEHYKPFFSDWPNKPDMGLFVVGYSANESLAEEYQIDVVSGECAPPKLLRPKDLAGMTWNGQTEAVTRLVAGFSPSLPSILQQNLGIQEDRIPAVMNVLQVALNPNLIQAAMPLQDAIDLASFLTETAISFSRFAPGASVVGGPIEVAAISKHEGFKWVERKHYYNSELNPPLPPGEARIAELSGFTSSPPVSEVPGTGPRPHSASTRTATKGAAKRLPSKKNPINGAVKKGTSKELPGRSGTR